MRIVDGIARGAYRMTTELKTWFGTLFGGREHRLTWELQQTLETHRSAAQALLEEAARRDTARMRGQHR